MNKDIIISATTSTSSEFQLYPSSPVTQENVRPTTLHFPDVHPITTVKPQQWQNPRKKRSKMTRLENMKAIGGGNSSSNRSTKPKCVKKPDPNAPKITRPCSECGKTFWSWKALFGHMRCHPERPWRGINPPPMVDHGGGSTIVTTNEDRYVASCLLMLANGTRDYDESGHDPGLFECSSCKKVFGSHQALGGHRASHKNVKGCFAITKKEGDEEGKLENMMMVVGSSEHKCSICLRVFSSGQALGGHKRCHWEKGEEEDDNDDVVAGTPKSVVLLESLGEYRVDLNMPPTHDEDYSRLGLDLRLGL